MQASPRTCSTIGSIRAPCYMNPVLRFLYWNMNYHIEHHMFPMVPYHALPKLHEELKPWMPKPYASCFAAYREIIPAILRQVRDPGWHVERKIAGRSRAGGYGDAGLACRRDAVMTAVILLPSPTPGEGGA